MKATIKYKSRQSGLTHHNNLIRSRIMDIMVLCREADIDSNFILKRAYLESDITFKGLKECLDFEYRRLQLRLEK